MKRWRKLKRWRKIRAVMWNLEWSRVRGLTLLARESPATVREVRAASKHINTVKVKKDLLNRRLSEYGLVTPARAQNAVWFFFKKYGSKKLKDNLAGDHQLANQ